LLIIYVGYVLAGKTMRNRFGLSLAEIFHVMKLYRTERYRIVCRKDVQRGCAEEGAGGGGREVHRQPAQASPHYFKQKYFF
jgi:hypothetical protein